MCGIAQMERVRVPTAFSFNPFEIKNLEWKLPRFGNSRNVEVKRLPSSVRQRLLFHRKADFQFLRLRRRPELRAAG